MRIPRIFHQIWVGPDPFPAEFARYRQTWLDHHPGWELKFWTEETFPKPWRSTVSAAVSTAIGGFIPIVPFFFTVGMPAVIASFIISTIAHFAVGASKALVTMRPWWATGLEMTFVGILEAAVTYGLGRAFAGR